MEARERLKVGIAKMYDIDPFFAYFLTRMKKIETKDVPTMGVDAEMNLYYNPDYVTRASDIQLAFVLIHEVVHTILQHTDVDRAHGKIREIWNIAIDVVANYYAHSDTHYRPEDWAAEILGENRVRVHVMTADGTTHSIEVQLSKKITEMTAEEIYEEILKHLKQNGYNVAEIHVVTTGGAGIEEKEVNGKKGESTGTDVHIHEKMSAEARSRIKTAVEEAIEVAKAMGSEPAFLRERIREIKAKAYVNWKKYVMEWVGRGVREDYTWERPWKAYWSSGIYLPGTKNSGKKLYVILDTSGSMSAEELGKAFGVIRSAMKKYGLSVVLIECDAKVTSVSEITEPSKLREREVTGRGGTDMNPALEYVRKRKGKKAVIITDGLMPDLDAKDMRVLIISTGETKHDTENVKWVKLGEVKRV